MFSYMTLHQTVFQLGQIIYQQFYKVHEKFEILYNFLQVITVSFPLKYIDIKVKPLHNINTV